MSCKEKIKLTPEEEKALNEAIFKILVENFDLVKKRIEDLDKPTERGCGDDYPIIDLKK